MTRSGSTAAALAFAMLFGAGSPGFAQEPRPTIAVANVTVSPGGWTLTPPQLSGTIVSLLVDELVASRQFHVYDGQWLVPESEAGGRVDLHRLRGVAAEKHVDYLVLGELTSFSTEQIRRRTGGILPKPFFVGGLSREQVQTAVDLSFRIVDVHTGEIVTTANAIGIGTRHSTGLGLLGILHPGLLVALAHSASAIHARDAMLNEAVRHAVHDSALALTRSQLPVTGSQLPVTERR